MGTAGLDLNHLIELLRRRKIDCALVEDDACQDHCVVKLMGLNPPNRVALVEYVNHGSESRIARIKLDAPELETCDDAGSIFWISQESIRLRGAQSDDLQKIVDVVEPLFAS
jgi:hypothetical protein